ncbi:MAG: hypothetical protein FJ184_16070, partial [Gammaproteobacteria bacterium]|nr:hypothetical protein [Gammaproteobacteria bacterium]
MNSSLPLPKKEAAPTSQAGAGFPSSNTCTDNCDTTYQFVNAETVLKPQAPSSPSITLGFERPGVSSTTLAAAGVRRVTSVEASAALGFAAYPYNGWKPNSPRAGTPRPEHTMKNGAPFIPAWLDDFGLDPVAFRVACHLWRRRNRKSGQCNPSID